MRAPFHCFARLAAVIALAAMLAPASAGAVDERGGPRSGLPPTQIETGGIPSNRDTLESTGAVTQGATGSALEREGAAIYAVHCTSCHGLHLQGSTNGPSLLGAGGSAVDFYVSTGRMPLAVPGTQGEHQQAQFGPREIAALDAYVTAHATSQIPIPHVMLDPRRRVRGRELFENNCEACHGAAAQGATVGYAWLAPPLDAASVTQIAEAVRIGPGMMPRFTRAQISPSDLDALITYVDSIVTQPENPGGTPFDYLGPLAEGLIAWVVGIGALFLVIYFTGTNARGERLSGRRR